MGHLYPVEGKKKVPLFNRYGFCDPCCEKQVWKY